MYRYTHTSHVCKITNVFMYDPYLLREREREGKTRKITVSKIYTTITTPIRTLQTTSAVPSLRWCNFNGKCPPIQFRFWPYPKNTYLSLVCLPLSVFTILKLSLESCATQQWYVDMMVVVNKEQSTYLYTQHQRFTGKQYEIVKLSW